MKKTVQLVGIAELNLHKIICLAICYTNHEQQHGAFTKQKRSTNLGDAPCLGKLIHFSLATSGTSDHGASPEMPGISLCGQNQCL